MRTYVSDSGGTTRIPKKIYVSDSGGTTRLVKKIYVSDSGGVTRLVYEGGYQFTITAGVVSGGGNTGYSNGLGTGGGVYGSISNPPAGNLPSGKIIAGVFDQTGGSNPQGAELVITSFASDPGKNSLVEIILNGHTYTGSSATYSFGSSARWSWGAANLYGLVNGNTYTGLIISNGSW